jgi:hypothetical protein
MRSASIHRTLRAHCWQSTWQASISKPAIPPRRRRWGREAEQSALSAGSVGYLTEVYRGLGNIERDTGGEPVALYEKSLEIARKNGLRLSEAQTLVEYARLQRATGNEEEARAFLEHAIGALEELGAAADARKAREELEQTPLMGDPQPSPG